MVSWALAAPPAPTPPDDRVVASVAVPHDIETIRREAPADAAAWRVRVRYEFLARIAEGLVAAFDSALAVGSVAGNAGLAMLRLDRVIEALDKGEAITAGGQAIAVDADMIAFYRTDTARKDEQKAQRL